MGAVVDEVGDVVDDEDLFDDWLDEFHEFLVGGFLEVVIFEGSLVLEGGGEDVGEAVVDAFGADVEAVFEGEDGGEFFLETGEGLDDLGDFFLGGVGLEFERTTWR